MDTKTTCLEPIVLDCNEEETVCMHASGTDKSTHGAYCCARILC